MNLPLKAAKWVHPIKTFKRKHMLNSILSSHMNFFPPKKITYNTSNKF